MQAYVLDRFADEIAPQLAHSSYMHEDPDLHFFFFAGDLQSYPRYSSFHVLQGLGLTYSWSLPPINTHGVQAINLIHRHTDKVQYYNSQLLILHTQEDRFE